jgi:hypothetical protein
MFCIHASQSTHQWRRCITSAPPPGILLRRAPACCVCTLQPSTSAFHFPSNCSTVLHPQTTHIHPFVLPIHLTMSSSQRICYTRNGTQITDTAYQPCNSDRTRDSSCCGINHSGAGHTGIANDVCDPNGLCQNFEAFDGTNGGEKLWWRQGCTDPTWESAECLKDVCNFARVSFFLK